MRPFTKTSKQHTNPHGFNTTRAHKKAPQELPLSETLKTLIRDLINLYRCIREEANRRGRGSPRGRASSRRAGQRAAKGLPALASPPAAAASRWRRGREGKGKVAVPPSFPPCQPHGGWLGAPPSPAGRGRRGGGPLLAPPHLPPRKRAAPAGPAYRQSAAPGSPQETRWRAAARWESRPSAGSPSATCRGR